MPTRSLARYMAARGFRTYLIDWGRPTAAHAGLGLADYVDRMMSEALTAIRRDSGSQELSLFGWCMGGLLSLMHAGLTLDRQIRNLVTVASPIDLRGGGVVAGLAGALDAPARLVRKYSDFRLMGVDPQKLTIPGWLLALGFKMTNPVASHDHLLGPADPALGPRVRREAFDHLELPEQDADLPGRCRSRHGAAAWPSTTSWPRARIRVDNAHRRDRCKIQGLGAGLRRQTATPSSRPRIARRRSSSCCRPQDKEYRVAPGGHMGVILGSSAPAREVWDPAADWLAPRSKARVVAAKPARKRAAVKAVKAATRLPRRLKAQAADASASALSLAGLVQGDRFGDSRGDHAGLGLRPHRAANSDAASG